MGCAGIPIAAMSSAAADTEKFHSTLKIKAHKVVLLEASHSHAAYTADVHINEPVHFGRHFLFRQTCYLDPRWQFCRANAIWKAMHNHNRNGAIVNTNMMQTPALPILECKVICIYTGWYMRVFVRVRNFYVCTRGWEAQRMGETE